MISSVNSRQEKEGGREQVIERGEERRQGQEYKQVKRNENREERDGKGKRKVG